MSLSIFREVIEKYGSLLISRFGLTTFCFNVLKMSLFKSYGA